MAETSSSHLTFPLPSGALNDGQVSSPGKYICAVLTLEQQDQRPRQTQPVKKRTGRATSCRCGRQ